ncbi:NAD(P)/FAD-dependent oxidoreductase [Sinorhizobium alkalisoli]|uniref:Gamma-glutamylputrescine oxidoreductase n=1 Tax=Sinorhizobium alkalisoli TaxID=1752398 RepID=A0A1E3VF27_9HYPH|nr:FAD-binding oxidoreductase [Sinorhizobium alkalisoli]MCA1494901.1 FAD-binding oxidoreductase [Ensifer sp. NBAIM29]MCG5479320.1 FAD-binding oxidoreductase [Sinorhizobium alkalisoli]ODR91711.1 gamma-glutamylputrescine oxidoreductase [Sinorhizobium alkalisoli]QFI67428.1 Gamma-glutamyl-putrescine oxidase [Sinorhizobium alkalisoli]
MARVRNSYSGDGSYPTSYYAASRNVVRTPLKIEGRIETDVCVVGAGYTGLSTAIHLAEKGYKVTVVEGAQVGWGASGRNGGQIVNGLNASLSTIGRRYGEGAARFIGGLVQEGGRIIRRLVNAYQIDCDLKSGNIYAAYTSAHMKELEAKHALWRKYGMDEHELLDREALRKLVNAEAYCGGMLDTTGGHMHPLNLVLGEARAFESLGGTIYEMSPVIRVDHAAARPNVYTQEGEVSARAVVLCGNAYLGDAVPELAARVMPVSTQMLATAPLGEELAQSLIPSDMCVEDVRYILDYFRLSADKRMIFGGGTVYGGTDPPDVAAKLKPNLEKVFPQLKGVKIDYAWSGNFALSFTRVPQMGRIGPNTYFAHGYSGHGVTGSHLFGRTLAEAIDGDAARFAAFEKLPWYPFPGGRMFRAQYSTIGSWWYSFRDAIGW